MTVIGGESGTATTLDVQPPLDGGFRGLAVNPHTNRVYLTHCATDPDTGGCVATNLIVVDGATKAPIATVPLQPQRTHFMEVNLVTTRSLSAHRIQVHPVLVVDGATNAVSSVALPVSSAGVGQSNA